MGRRSRFDSLSPEGRGSRPNVPLICWLTHCSLRLVDAAIVPTQRVDRDHSLGAVEQRCDLAAGRLVGELRHAVAYLDGGVAHDVETLVDLEDLEIVRVERGIEFR